MPTLNACSIKNQNRLKKRFLDDKKPKVAFAWAALTTLKVSNSVAYVWNNACSLNLERRGVTTTGAKI
jgi:hypothetical protein